MNINNVVLVRAMDNLPLNGELIPSCEGERLINDNQSDFHYFMMECITSNIEQQLGRKLLLLPDFPDYELLKDAMKDYYVLTGDYYTTTLSFALNGLVPDDINNQFTDKKMAILEPIKNQMNANFITIETIDTTIKGRIKTSNEAILVIQQEFFSKLSQDEQANLMSNYKIKLFESDLKNAINDTLIENGYPVLPLIQKKEMKNIEECPEKESMLDFEDRFSIAVGASRLRLQHLTLSYNGGTELDSIAHEKLAEEHTNTLKVNEYYKKQLYEFIINKAESLGIEVSNEDKYYLFSNDKESSNTMKKLITSLIQKYGSLENFKQFIIEYNNYIKDNYLTNQQIVSTINNIQK